MARMARMARVAGTAGTREPAQARDQNFQDQIGRPVHLAFELEFRVRQGQDGVPTAGRAEAAGGVEGLAGGERAAPLGNPDRRGCLGLRGDGRRLGLQDVAEVTVEDGGDDQRVAPVRAPGQAVQEVEGSLGLPPVDGVGQIPGGTDPAWPR